MIVSVLGAESEAFATAADLALAEHRVRLWARDADAIKAVHAANGITLDGEGRRGVARLERSTTDIAEAVRGADVVVVPLAATSHEEIAKRLAPHLEERQIVLLMPGIFGSYAIARDIARAGGRLPGAIVESAARSYVARKTAPAAVTVAARAANLPVGVFPAARSDAAAARVAELFAGTRPCRDALDAALANVGPVLHPPWVVVGAGAMDQGRFDARAAARTATAQRLVEALDRERVATRHGWGYSAPHGDVNADDEVRSAQGEAVDFEHRYVVEDVALGLSLLESAARTVNVESPATTGLLLLFGTLLRRPLSGRGRALEAIGLGDLLRREISELLHDGWLSPVWKQAIR